MFVISSQKSSENCNFTNEVHITWDENRTTITCNFEETAHHLGISYYVKFWGRLGSNGFQLKLRFGTHGN